MQWTNKLYMKISCCEIAVYESIHQVYFHCRWTCPKMKNMSGYQRGNIYDLDLVKPTLPIYK
jgi:hypothetical protein